MPEEENKKEESHHGKTKGETAPDDIGISDVSVLKKKIKYLEEELVRKDQALEKLKKENLILFKTALKRSENKVDSKLAGKKAIDKNLEKK